MTPRRAKVKTVLYVFRDQLAQLKKLAEKTDQNVSRLIRIAVDEYLANKKRRL